MRISGSHTLHEYGCKPCIFSILVRVGAFKSLSEGDLQKADEALSHVNGVNGAT